MVRSTTNVDATSGRQAIILHVWSESDSLPFLKARMELAVTRLTNMLESNYTVVAAPSQDEVVNEAVNKAIEGRRLIEKARG